MAADFLFPSSKVTAGLQHEPQCCSVSVDQEVSEKQHSGGFVLWYSHGDSHVLVKSDNRQHPHLISTHIEGSLVARGFFSSLSGRTNQNCKGVPAPEARQHHAARRADEKNNSPCKDIYLYTHTHAAVPHAKSDTTWLFSFSQGLLVFIIALKWRGRRSLVKSTHSRALGPSLASLFCLLLAQWSDPIFLGLTC